MDFRKRAIALRKRKERIAGVGRTDTHPAVYVGTYKKYNNGSLFGEWVDLTKFATYEDFMRYIRNLHKDERDPEFMMQDFEGYPESWYYEGGMDEDTFYKIKDFYEVFKDDEAKQAAYYAMVEDGWNDLTIPEFEDRYFGTFDSEADYIGEMIEEGVIDPAELARKEGDWVYDIDAIWHYYDTGGDLSSVRTDYGAAIFFPGSFH